MHNLFLVITILVALTLLAIFWYTKRPKYLRYKEEIIHGALWRWKWSGRTIVGLWCYCPNCKGSLTFDDTLCKATQKLGDKSTFFICTHCEVGQVGSVKGGDRRYVLTLVKRDILRKAQTLPSLKGKNES
ncbi:MAG: hypothetical protein GX780_03585 [Campylobacteraceae bacterium]|nr:hypothetical protein [Campylobacteraceae bacterium]